MTKSESVFQRLAGPFVEFGLPAGAIYVLDRLFAKLPFNIRLHLHDYMVQPVSDKRLLPERFANRYEIREIKRGDPELALMPISPEVVEWRWEQPVVCLGAFQNGSLVGYLWLCFGDYKEDEVRSTYVLAQPLESAFDFDVYIFPKYRMGLGFAGIWDGANQFLSQRGVRFTFCRMTRFNVASAKAHAHLGGKRVGRAVYLCVGATELMLATLAPYIHLSTGASNRVRLRLSPDVLLR